MGKHSMTPEQERDRAILEAGLKAQKIRAERAGVPQKSITMVLKSTGNAK